MREKYKLYITRFISPKGIKGVLPKTMLPAFTQEPKSSQLPALYILFFEQGAKTLQLCGVYLNFYPKFTQHNPLPMKKPAAPRTPLLRTLQKAFKIAFRANKTHEKDLVSILQMESEKAVSRRRFLSTTAKVALIAGVAGMGAIQTGCKKEETAAKIAIVGAGMAGLHAAYRLKQAGHIAQIYEASERTGGRMYTAANIMGTGITTELGGEFIDSIHDDMLQLVNTFGLQLLDTQTDTGVIKDAFFFNGLHYTLEQVIAEFQPIAAQMQADIDAIYNDFDAAAATLDLLSLDQYLDDIGATGWLKSLLSEAYVTEYGLDAGEQSCINMLYLISADTSGGTFNIFGESDERYKIAGGNQTLVDRLANEVSNAISVGHKLEAVYKSGNSYKLSFQTGGTSVKEVTADFVLLTLPFTVLREVYLDAGLNLPPEKVSAINELGYGTNAKLMLGFTGRPWRNNGYSGYLFTDNGLQTGWDNSQLQASPDGGYTVYSGGTTGVQVGNGTPQSQSGIYLPKLEQVFPGALNLHNGKAERFHWPTHPYTKGSYACYKTGQWLTIAGNEFPAVDNLFFAGEHCSEDYQGYMNGSAETGRIAADEIMAKLG